MWVFLGERERREGVPGDSGEGREGARADGGEFGAWNSESLNVGGGTESSGRGVVMKAVILIWEWIKQSFSGLVLCICRLL